MAEKKPSDIAKIKKYFGMSIPDFKAEWDQLSNEEKDWFKQEMSKVEK